MRHNSEGKPPVDFPVGDRVQQALRVAAALRVYGLVVEQNAKVALDFASRGYVLKTGAIIAAGSSEELAANPDVKKAYLGG